MRLKMAQELISIKQLAEKLGIHADTVRALYRKKQITGIKIGYRTLRFDFEQVVKELKEKEKERKAILKKYYEGFSTADELGLNLSTADELLANMQKQDESKRKR